jgi:endonuclease YncB( thermonuclease family)
VRLIGIDTPEVYGGRECGGRQASKSMNRLLDRRDRVRLVKDFGQDRRDRYGRLLRYVERRHHDVGKRQIARGWAKVYVYGGNPFKRVRKYRRAKRGARNHHRGVWGRCNGHFHDGL